jgi:endonuclease/exonuclease/phosphatase family metal-dependent hydrolase
MMHLRALYLFSQVRHVLLASLILTTFTGCSESSSPDVADSEESIRAMTFNIRWASPNDGAHVWENRSDWVSALIDTSSADFVGLQEVTHRQLVDIMAVQDRFDWIGVGRDDGLQGGEYSPILFDSSRFELVSWDTKWLSATPDVVGSVGWDAALPRVATRAQLRDVRTEQVIRVINTHFDHRGNEARVQSAAMIGDWSETHDLALGDFNIEPASEAYQMMIEGGWIDAGLNPPILPAEPGTFRTFDPGSETSVRIDFIFHRPAWKVTSYEVLDPIVGGAYPSDHLPVVADLVRLSPTH